jgi:hypothetical protein
MGSHKKLEEDVGMARGKGGKVRGMARRGWIVLSALMALAGVSLWAKAIALDVLQIGPMDPLVLKDLRRPRAGEPLVFAIPHYVSITPWNSGNWWEDERGQKVWELVIRAPGALSLSLGFGKYRLPQGARLEVWRPGEMAPLWTFTDMENSTHGQMWTPILRGDEALLRLVLQDEQTRDLELELTAVGYGFREISTPRDEGKEVYPKLPQAGPCNVDVSCPEAEPWEREARSVGLVTIGGSILCTGTLLNNTSQDFTPLFLTANHCGITPSNAQSVVVYWNYQKSTCNGPSDGRKDQFTSGSFFRAAWSSSNGSDFSLVELARRPQSTSFPHWSGWYRGESLPEMAVAIHHPQGGEKKISFEFDPLTVAGPEDRLSVGRPELFLKVGAWDKGTTEPGSSGCGLWNQDHRLVGQLWGGSASCENPKGSDYFGRFWASWEGGGAPENRLKDHLDPLDTAPMAIDGADGCLLDQVDFTFWPNPSVIGEEVQFVAQVSGARPPVDFSWDMDGDGFWDCASSSCTFSYLREYHGDARLRVVDADGCIGSASHAVNVIDPEAGVRFLSPQAGDKLFSGEEFLVRWAAPQRAVRFKLLYSLNGGASWKVITKSATGRSLKWLVPTPSGNKSRCLLKLIGYDSSGKKIGSQRTDGFFTISVVELTTLKGGEKLRAGEAVPLAWLTHGTKEPVSKVKLLYKMRSSRPWKPIVTLEGNPGSYIWRIPDVDRVWDDCWLKVVLLSEKGESLGSDTTDSPFAIEP